MTSSIAPRRSGPLLTLILSAVAVMALGCGSSGKSGTTKSTSTTSAAATTPAGQDDLTGNWSGSYTGAYNGTLNVAWQQSGWAQSSAGVFRSNLNGSIKLSAPPGTLSIHGTVRSACPNPPCNTGDTIKFGTLGGGGIIYTGTVSNSHM